MELQRTETEGLDITSAATVLTYAHSGTAREVIARVELGDDDGPVAGGGDYLLRFLINGSPVLPENLITVSDGVTSFVAVTREIPIEDGDVVTLQATGRAGLDVAVDVVASLRDATPLREEELTGDGSVLVDEDYGGADALRFIDRFARGIDNATVRAFLKSDYDAGNRGRAYVVAETTTDVEGRWSRPMMLDPAAYTLLYFKQGAVAPKTHTLVVTED